MLTQLIFLRHGQTQQPNCLLGSSDVALSEEGWEQLRTATAQLKYVDKVVTSPLLRTSQFAQEFARERQLELQQEKELAECDFGEWDGLSYQLISDQFSKLYSEFLVDPISNPPPKGERVSAFYQRVVQTIESLVNKNPGKKILIITHGGVIRCAVSWCLKLDFIQQSSLANVPFQRLQVDYASVTQINVWKQQSLLPQLIVLNQTKGRY